MCSSAMLYRKHVRPYHHSDGLFSALSAAALIRMSEAANAADLRHQVLDTLGRYPGDKEINDNDKRGDDDPF